MIYLVGIAGFICGFCAGQMILAWLLRDRTKEEVLEMMKDSESRWRYGMLNWAVAAAGASAFVLIYKKWFIY
jgi:hypothetical protein